MVMSKEIKKVAIIGRGAIGLLYGVQVAEVLGDENVKFVLDDARLEAKATQKITVNGKPLALESISCAQAKEFAPDLVIVAIKTTGMDLTLQMMQQFVTPETLLISFCNGVTSEERMASVFGWKNLPLCVVQGMDATFVGNEMTCGNKGDLLMGAAPETSPEAVESINAFFDKCDFSHGIYDDIRRRQWCKWMLNVGINQTCMAYSCTYGKAHVYASEENRTFVGAMREAMACALAEGVDVSEKDLKGLVDLTSSLTPNLMPSMAQDRVNHKKTEVEEFSGTVISLGKKHGIYVPINQWLYDTIKNLENSYSD